MKLSTMLLPTGEFVLIASEASSPELADSLFEFRKLIGAAAAFVTNEPVEVTNALIDENAKRREEPGVEARNNSFSGDPSIAQNDLGIVDYWTQPEQKLPETDITKVHLPSWTQSPDASLLNLFYGGAGGSPAGLVKLTDEQKAERTESYADTHSLAGDACACYPVGVEGPMCVACPLTGTCAMAPYQKPETD